MKLVQESRKNVELDAYYKQYKFQIANETYCTLNDEIEVGLLLTTLIFSCFLIILIEISVFAVILYSKIIFKET